VDAVLGETMAGRAVRVPGELQPPARGADDERGGQGEPDVVGSVIGKELAGPVKLMTVPSAVQINTDLGKPLAEKIVVVDDACPGDGPGDLAFPADFQDDGFSGGHGPGQVDRGDRPVHIIDVVRMLEGQGGLEVEPLQGRVFQDFYGIDPDPSPVLFFKMPDRVLPGGASLGHEGRGVVGESVPVKMKPERFQRIRGRVGPHQDFPAGDDLPGRIQPHVHRVVGHLRAQCI